MDPESLFYGRALARIQNLSLFLTIAGAIAAAIRGGFRWAVAYLLGAAAGTLHFRWLKQMVNALSAPATGKPPGTRVGVVFGLRYLLLGSGAYVILNFTALSLAAALVGLFVPVAAVSLEILYELVYAGT
jgi:hypothetical protein